MARTRAAAAAAEATTSAVGGTYPAWARSAKEVLEHFEVTPARGLSQQQVLAARARHGFNELEKEQSKPLWKLVLEQFDDPLVKVRTLAAAAAAEECSCPRPPARGRLAPPRAPIGAAAWR